MKTLKAREGASEIWNSLEAAAQMHEAWTEMPDKVHQEQIIAKLVGPAAKVLDLGCGSGRLIPYLFFETYVGLDTCEKLLAIAREARECPPKIVFHKQDIFIPSKLSLATFDCAVMYDVAQHMCRPLAAIKRTVQLWSASYYVFSLLVGTKFANLADTSTVIPFNSLLPLLHRFGGTYEMYVIECIDANCFWVAIKWSPEDPFASQRNDKENVGSSQDEFPD